MRYHPTIAISLALVGLGCRNPSEQDGLDPAITLQVTVNPGQLSVAQDWNGKVGFNVNAVGGSVPDVSLGLEAPAGVSGTFDAAAESLTVSVGPDVAPGRYDLFVRARGTGARDGVAQLALEVRAPLLARFDVSRCAASDWPVFAAYQDEPTAPWRALPTGQGVIDLVIRGGRPALAAVNGEASGGFVARAWFYSAAEMASIADRVHCSSTPPPPGKPLVVNITNLPAGNIVSVSIGPDETATVLAQPLTLRFIPDGLLDLVGYAYDLNVGAAPTDRLFLQRDIVTTGLAPGSVAAELDLIGPGSSPPVGVPMTVANLLPGESYSPSVAYYTRDVGCSRHSLYSSPEAQTDSQFVAYGVPSALQRPTDRHEIGLFAVAGTAVRMLSSFVGPLAPSRLVLPPQVPEPTVTVLGPAGRMRFDLRYALKADDELKITSRAGGPNVAQLAASRGYLVGDAISLAFPDLRTVTGWSDAWLDGTTAPQWDVQVGNEVLGVARCESGQSRFASRTNITGGRTPSR